MGEKTRVVVAMSGGVDSSLTAALLVYQGYEVIGVTMKLWENDNLPQDNRGCCSLAAVEDARRVAEKLNIPHYALNFKEMFQKTVIDYFINEYSRGKTPNPCIACNRYVKFEGLLDKALALNAKYVATGHYARIVYDSVRKKHLLLRGTDASKDQSYALYHLTQNTLKHFMMPLGVYSKQETRALAKKWGLLVADKPDSQEICFIPSNDYKSFLKEKIPAALIPGKIVDTSGKILGEHQGIQLFTVGQRKGLGIAVGKPAYVIAINAEKNEVVIGDANQVFARGLEASDLNFIGVEPITRPVRAEVKIRYNAPPVKAVIFPLIDGKVKVEFRSPQKAVAPGQSAVFYNGDEVIGGGIIEKASYCFT